MKPQDTGFYVVMRDDDVRMFRHEHVPGADPAGQEAMRLAAHNPGHKFYVLKTIRVAEHAPTPPPPPPPPNVTLRPIELSHSKRSPYEADDHLPF